jgi:hypothetical protein
MQRSDRPAEAAHCQSGPPFTARHCRNFDCLFCPFAKKASKFRGAAFCNSWRGRYDAAMSRKALPRLSRLAGAWCARASPAWAEPPLAPRALARSTPASRRGDGDTPGLRPRCVASRHHNDPCWRRYRRNDGVTGYRVDQAKRGPVWIRAPSRSPLARQVDRVDLEGEGDCVERKTGERDFLFEHGPVIAALAGRGGYAVGADRERPQLKTPRRRRPARPGFMRPASVSGRMERTPRPERESRSRDCPGLAGMAAIRVAAGRKGRGLIAGHVS